MKTNILVFMTICCCSILPSQTQNRNGFIKESSSNLQESSSSTISKLQHFKFKSRNVRGKKIAIVSFKADPERDRRSILVPDAEGLLQPQLFAPLRHHHRFLPPFEDENMFSLNSSINWQNHVNKFPPSRETAEIRALNEIDNTLQDLEKILEKRENAMESSPLNLNTDETNRREKNKNKKRKRNKKREKKKEKRKKNDDKKKRKPRAKMHGQEACQYRILKKCAKSLGLIPKNDVQNLTEYEICDQRKEFLECVEKRRLNKPCKIRAVARGNLPSLRTWIKKLFWTSSSCLLNEAMKRR